MRLAQNMYGTCTECVWDSHRMLKASRGGMACSSKRHSNSKTLYKKRIVGKILANSTFYQNSKQVNKNQSASVQTCAEMHDKSSIIPCLAARTWETQFLFCTSVFFSTAMSVQFCFMTYFLHKCIRTTTEMELQNESRNEATVTDSFASYDGVSTIGHQDVNQ